MNAVTPYSKFIICHFPRNSEKQMSNIQKPITSRLARDYKGTAGIWTIGLSGKGAGTQLIKRSVSRSGFSKDEGSQVEVTRR